MGSVPNTPAFAAERAAEGRARARNLLNLEPMFNLALDPKHMDDEDELRLVGRVDEILPGEVATPAASQVRGATLVVAHLRYAPLPQPVKDRNTKQDIKESDDKSEAAPVEL